MPRIFTSEQSLQSDPLMEGLQSGQAHKDAQRELELQAERYGAYSRNVAMAEEAHAADMEVFKQQQGERAAAQEMAELQARVGDQRARAMVEGGMPESEDELAIYARLSPGKGGDQELWKEDKRARLEQAKSDKRRKSSMLAAQHMLTNMEDGPERMQRLRDAPSEEAFNAEMQQNGADWAHEIEERKLSAVATSLETLLMDPKNMDVEVQDRLGSLLDGIADVDAQGNFKVSPDVAAARMEPYDPAIFEKLLAATNDKGMARQMQASWSDMAGQRAMAAEMGGMPTEAGEADTPVAPGPPMPEPPPVPEDTTKSFAGLTAEKQKIFIKQLARIFERVGRRSEEGIAELKRLMKRENIEFDAATAEAVDVAEHSPPGLIDTGPAWDAVLDAMQWTSKTIGKVPGLTKPPTTDAERSERRKSVKRGRGVRD